MTPAPRLPSLDGLRGLAIAAVVLHHLFGLPLLWGGVDLFFVLSGFLITGILVNTRTLPWRAYLGHFYARRARRLLPAYLVALALTAAVFGTWWLRPWPFYFGAMNLLKLLGLPAINTLPLWSLALEEQFYLLWPIACFLLPRRGLLRLSLALVVLAPILRVLATPVFAAHWAIYMLLPFRMDTLAAGAAVALVWPHLQPLLTASRRRRLIPAALLVCVGALGLLLWLRRLGLDTNANTRLSNFAIYECVLAIALMALLLALAGFGRTLLASWPLVWLGRISFSLYLSHLGFIKLATPGGHRVLGVAAALVYSVAMWWLVESPILSRGRRPPMAVLASPPTQREEAR